MRVDISEQNGVISIVAQHLTLFDLIILVIQNTIPTDQKSVTLPEIKLLVGASNCL
jgi:hypothetical protein